MSSWERLFFFCYSSTPKGLVHTNTLPMLFFFSPKSSPAKQLDSNQQRHSDTPWETVGTEPVYLSTPLPPSISLISATSVPSHSPYHRGLTTHQPSWPVGWRFCSLNHNTSFCKHKLSPNAPESTLSSHTTMPAPRVLVCKNHQWKLPEIYIQGFVPWIHGWEQSKSANSLQFGWAKLVQWPLPVLCVSYAYLISSSSTTQMPRDS